MAFVLTALVSSCFPTIRNINRIKVTEASGAIGPDDVWLYGRWDTKRESVDMMGSVKGFTMVMILTTTSDVSKTNQLEITSAHYAFFDKRRGMFGEPKDLVVKQRSFNKTGKRRFWFEAFLFPSGHHDHHNKGRLKEGKYLFHIEYVLDGKTYICTFHAKLDYKKKLDFWSPFFFNVGKNCQPSPSLYRELLPLTVT